MVSAALFSVERVLAAQLSAVGTTYDAAGIAAELKDYVKKADDAAAQAQGIQDANIVATQSSDKVSLNGVTTYKTPEVKTAELVFVQLDELHAKLQACVLRAKMS